MKPFIFLDLDGVCCDFVGHILSYFGKSEQDFMDEMAKYPNMHPYDALEQLVGLSKNKFWEFIDDLGTKFWSDMPKFEWFDDMYKRLTEIGEVYFLSSSPSQYACYGKFVWVEKHVNHKAATRLILCIAHAKYFLAGPDRVLIDDTDKNIKDWKAKSAPCYYFPSIQFHKRHPTKEDIDNIVDDIKKKFIPVHKDGILLTE